MPGQNKPFEEEKSNSLNNEPEASCYIQQSKDKLGETKNEENESIGKYNSWILILFVI